MSAVSVDLTLSVAVLTLVSSGSLILRIRRLSKTRYRQMSACAYVRALKFRLKALFQSLVGFILKFCVCYLLNMKLDVT